MNDTTSLKNFQPTSMATALISNHELSIPAFLQMQFGIDFRSEEFLARGGGGSLYKCSWLSLELAEACQRQPLVVKMVCDGDIETLQPRARTVFFQEITVMHKCRDHPLFCKVYAYSLKPASMVIA